MICLELRKRGKQHCGCRPNAGVEYCAFLRGQKCYVGEHNQAVRRGFDAGINREPLSVDLLPENYRLPAEGGK